MRTRRIGAILALLAAAGLGWGALSTGWYGLETAQSMRVGPLGAERCDAAGCSSVTLGRLGVDSNLGRLGVLAAASGALAALVLLITAGLGLTRRESLGRLPAATLALALFAMCAGLAFHLLAPFADSMAVGLPAFVFFGGAATAGATAAMMYDALKRSGG